MKPNVDAKDLNVSEMDTPKLHSEKNSEIGYDDSDTDSFDSDSDEDSNAIGTFFA